MFISDKKELTGYTEVLRREAKLCLIAALVCAVFGGIYEMFSHQVYSAYMIGAFAIPLLLGAVPAYGIVKWIRHQTCDMMDKDMMTAQPAEKYWLWEVVSSDSTPAQEKDMSSAGIPYGVTDEDSGWDGFCLPGRICRNAWFSGIAALTVGCIFRGILEIYGTTNRLITVYPVAAAALMCVAAAAWIIPLVTIWRMARES